MRKILLIAVSVIVLTSLTAACGKDSAKKTGEVVATVDGKEITTEDIKRGSARMQGGCMSCLLMNRSERNFLMI